MIASWPEVEASHFDPVIEARFARFQELLKGLREIRSRQNIPPKTRVDFVVRCSTEAADLLRPMEVYFESMAGASARGWGPEVTPPGTSASYNLPGVELFVDLAGLIDVVAEAAKNQKEREKLLGFIAAKEKKLSNESFISRAPADVVEKEREGLNELRDRLTSIESYLAQLQQKP